MGQILSSLCTYEKVMALMLLGRPYSYQAVRTAVGLPPAGGGGSADQLFAAAHLHSIGTTLRLYGEPHYRAPSLGHDLVANFSNISVPGTGFNLSWLFCSPLLVRAYFLLGHPFVVAAAAVRIRLSAAHRAGRGVGQIFADELLRPGCWFALWRINSTLVALHHFRRRSDPTVEAQYAFENKWEFIRHGLAHKDDPAFRRLKVTPVMEVEELVCKHRNMEGGMGVHIFRSATAGGDWIIQKRLTNAAEIQRLLPPAAPLSTFRVITMRRPGKLGGGEVWAVTTVFRAGRRGKRTDHSAVLVPVEGRTLQAGQMFGNWYALGAPGPMLSTKGVAAHPDTQQRLEGEELPAAESAAEMCVEAHKAFVPDVPIAGWDLAVTAEEGAVLLETNLSCNLFGGVYDREEYAAAVDAWYQELEE